MFVDVYVSKNLYFSFIYICTINGFLLPKIPHSWFLKNRDSKKQTQKAWLSDIAIFFHVQIHCACQWIMTLPPKILWPTALLNTWNIITFPKSSFYHTNHTFLTNINVWMMDFSSINTRIKKISSAQNTILCREWLLQKLTFRHSEITIFNHSHNPTQRTFGEPQAPSVYISTLLTDMERRSPGRAWERVVVGCSSKPLTLACSVICVKSIMAACSYSATGPTVLQTFITNSCSGTSYRTHENTLLTTHYSYSKSKQ